MFQFVYRMDLLYVCLLMLALQAGWAFFCVKAKSRTFTGINAELFCVSVVMILYVTVFVRTSGGTYLTNLRPFATFAAARRQRELYRAMLMNVFLFFPLGLTLSNALPQKWSRWRRVALTTLLGCALSIGIEYAQYRFSLGMTETDDVICNTLGAFLGACSLLIAYAVERRQRKQK